MVTIDINFCPTEEIKVLSFLDLIFSPTPIYSICVLRNLPNLVSLNGARKLSNATTISYEIENKEDRSHQHAPAYRLMILSFDCQVHEQPLRRSDIWTEYYHFLIIL